MIFNSPVYPILPSFDEEEMLEFESTREYLSYLESSGAKTVMTTAGTSQFNLLSINEIRDFNKVVSEFNGKKILGLPQVSLLHLKGEIDYLNEQNLKDCFILILFPERYYNDDQIYDFFVDVCSYSNYPVMVHGNIIKRGNGGNYEYSRPLLERLVGIDNFIGMKEEASTLMHSINNMPNGLEIIVAGGSMRRFWSLEPHGATTYLSGVGSFNPNFEELFYENYYKDIEVAKKIMNEIETPLFKTFMTIGWHASMRAALREMGYIKYDRKPFYQIANSEKQAIKIQLNKIKK